MSSGDFSIGSKVWPGVSKVIEEMGELQQVFGKLIGAAGGINHWDGSNLREKLIEEIADLQAALDFFKSVCLTFKENARIEDRVRKKSDLFRQWHRDPVPLTDEHDVEVK